MVGVVGQDGQGTGHVLKQLVLHQPKVCIFRYQQVNEPAVRISNGTHYEYHIAAALFGTLFRLAALVASVSGLVLCPGFNRATSARCKVTSISFVGVLWGSMCGLLHGTTEKQNL